jgi:site-specific DNA-methyltransferase (adenine-specific)
MIKEWIYKGINENKKGKTVVFLIPARTDTTWFQALLDLGNVEFRFIKGRLHFDDSKNPAPFPSVISILMGSQS